MPHISDTLGNYDSAELKQSLNELQGLAHGLMADAELTDSEITYLDEWLDKRHAITTSFPGNVLHQRIKEVLADGVVTEEEREHLVSTLNSLIEGRLIDLAGEVDLSELWFDETGPIEFYNNSFCLTGNFVYGPINVCKSVIEYRGGEVLPMVESDLQYLVVGGLGVEEWRSGGLGTDIETALKLRRSGAPVKIIPEDRLWEKPQPPG